MEGQQWQQALAVLAAMQLTAVLPDVITGGAAISACEKGLQGQQALCVWAVTHRTAGMHVVISYNAAVSACEKLPSYLLIYIYSVLVMRASIGSRPWEFWPRCS